MALSISNLVKKTPNKPPIIVIYGPGGVGKTTFASEFPNPVFIQTEDGAGELEITSFSEGPLSTYAQVDEALTALATEEHAFRTLVVDSVTRLEPLVWDAVCKANKWANIEEPGYGKGYALADSYWRNFMDACIWLRDNKGMTIVLLGHEAVQSFNDPSTASYDRYQLRLHKRAEALVRESCDVMGFMNQITTVSREKGDSPKAGGSGQVALNLAPRPSFQAKSRFSTPGMVLTRKGAGYAALAPYLPGHREKLEAPDAA